MKNYAFSALLLACAFAPFARADVPAVPLPVEQGVPLVIEVNAKANESRLIIPKKFLGVMKGALDTESRDQRASNTPAMHTIIAGGALALALAFGGLWMVRKGPGSRNLALLIGAVALLGVGGLVWADVGIKPRPNVPPERLLQMGMDKVIIEVVDKGDQVKLIVNKDKLAKALQDKAK